jgi:cytochrome c oxidase subunit 4
MNATSDSRATPGTTPGAPGSPGSPGSPSGQADHGHELHLVPYKVYVGVWLALVMLTLVTIGAGYADLKHMGIFVAMLIATVKVTLVILYFMHVRWAPKVIGWFLLTGFGTYATFVILTFSDYVYR